MVVMVVGKVSGVVVVGAAARGRAVVRARGMHPRMGWEQGGCGVMMYTAVGCASGPHTGVWRPAHARRACMAQRHATAVTLVCCTCASV